MQAGTEPPCTGLERARGALGVTLRAAGVGRLREEGCLRMRFPAHGGGLEGVMINTAGGVAGGDRLQVEATLTEGAAAVLTSQAAERVYRARPQDAAATWDTTLTLGAGAALDWLPQELILFDGAALRRSLTVRLAADASFIGAEMVVMGRKARGERIERLHFDDLVRVEHPGTLLLHDATRLRDAEFRAEAAMGDQIGYATVLCAAPGAERRLEAVRAALPHGRAGATSPLPGLLVARLLAPDGATLRRDTLRALAVLRDGRHPPRVWQC